MSAHLYIAVLLWSVVATAVGVHASNRDRAGFFWGILTFVTGFVGLIVYLVVVGNARDAPSREEDVVVCPNCSARHAGSPRFCSDCGEALEGENETSTASIVRSGSNAYCGNCHGRVEFDTDACPSCGSVF